MEGASDVYIYIMLLLLGIAIQAGGNTFARGLRYYDHATYMWFMDSFIWPLRCLLELIILCVIAFTMSRRVVTSYNLMRRFGIDHATTCLSRRLKRAKEFALKFFKSK